MRPPGFRDIGALREGAIGVGSGLTVGRILAVGVVSTLQSEALKGKKPTRNANSKIKVNKEAGPISPVLMD